MNLHRMKNENGNIQETPSIGFNPKFPIMLLWRRGHTTASRRSTLITDMCTTEADAEKLIISQYANSTLSAQRFWNVLLARLATTKGSHTMVTSKSAIAKLNRRKFDGRRRRGFVATATQTSKLPNVPNTPTIAFVEIRAIP